MREKKIADAAEEQRLVEEGSGEHISSHAGGSLTGFPHTQELAGQRLMPWRMQVSSSIHPTVSLTPITPPVWIRDASGKRVRDRDNDDDTDDTDDTDTDDADDEQAPPTKIGRAHV